MATFTIRCPQCQALLGLRDEHRGKQVLCGKCQVTMVVPPLGSPPVPAQAPEPLPEPDPLPELVPTRRTAPRSDPTNPFDFERLADVHPWLVSNPFGPTPARKGLRDLSCRPLPQDCSEEVQTLGEPLATIRANVLPLWGWVLLVVGTWVGLTVLSWFWNLLFRQNLVRAGDAGDMLGWILCFGLMLLLAGMGFVILRRLLRTALLWFCQQGVVWQEGRKVGWCRWGEIAQFRSYAAVLVRESLFGMYRTGERYEYELVVPGGRRFVLRSNEAGDARVFGERLEQKITAAVLPEMLRRLQSGDTVECQPFAFTRQRLHFGQAEAGWESVQQVRLAKGIIQIDVMGQNKWAEVPYGLVSHARAFMILAELLLQIQQESGSSTVRPDEGEENPFQFS